MRVHNFNPGPAALPLQALQQAQSELTDFQNTGMSVLEHSHRGLAYGAIHDEAQERIRSVLNIPDTHDTLWVQGGASLQFAMAPMNLLRKGAFAQYLTTGTWSEKALAEAAIVGDAREACSTREQNGAYRRVPSPEEVVVDAAATYVHLTSNNTIFGTQYPSYPDTQGVPLVGDLSSDLLSRPVPWERFGLAYACAQKNLGPAGITLVVIRKDWIEAGSSDLPHILRYSTYSKANSLQNTIPTFAMYMVLQVLRWVDELGGQPAIEERNRRKAALLYELLDGLDGFVECPVERTSRSQMSVVFRLVQRDLEPKFLSAAQQAGFVGLKGHRSVGGMRASLYNAVEPASVEALVGWIEAFARRH